MYKLGCVCARHKIYNILASVSSRSSLYLVCLHPHPFFYVQAGLCVARRKIYKILASVSSRSSLYLVCLHPHPFCYLQARCVCASFET
jgi:hypothetical protein